jgi:hypothetical protein
VNAGWARRDCGEMPWCVECGRLGEGPMDGWRALLGVDVDDEDAPEQAYLFCPDCAGREFGPPRGAARSP